MLCSLLVAYATSTCTVTQILGCFVDTPERVMVVRRGIFVAAARPCVCCFSRSEGGS